MTYVLILFIWSVGMVVCAEVGSVQLQRRLLC